MRSFNVGCPTIGLGSFGNRSWTVDTLTMVASILLGSRRVETWSLVNRLSVGCLKGLGVGLLSRPTE